MSLSVVLLSTEMVLADQFNRDWILVHNFWLLIMTDIGEKMVSMEYENAKDS